MYANAAVSFSGDDAVVGLDPAQFHTFRFESLDGSDYSFAVNGLIFTSGLDNESGAGSFLQFGGRGGCIDDQIPNAFNKWDFVRYGTIDYGEQIVETGPPAGFVDARQHPALDRFTVRYDSPNYVYIDEIVVDVVGNEATRQRQNRFQTSNFELPVVVATRRRDNGPPDVVEIVLDRPIPYNATTRFTFDEGTLAQSVEFTCASGDIDGDGVATLADFAAFQNCFSTEPPSGVCLVLNFDSDADVDLLDFAKFQNLFMNAE